MILYHGSNTKVEAVDLSRCRPNKDFGQGFYLTPDKSYTEGSFVTIKKDSHKAESAANEITQQTAAAAVGVSDFPISDYLNKNDYEDNAWVLAARFWHGLYADLQQLTIVADIIQTKLHHKLATIDKMDALSLYTQVLPHFIAKMPIRQRRCV